MDIQQYFKPYAELLVKVGLNVQPGQLVNIGAEAINRDLVVEIASAAYRAGAKFVSVDLADSRIARARILQSKPEHLAFVPRYITEKYSELVDERAANLKLVGGENPDILSDLDPKAINTARIAQYQAMKRFYDEGIFKSKVHWTVAAASTPGWAAKVFPGADPAEADRKLWEAIFKICRVDRSDPVAIWHDHHKTLQARAAKLTGMKIKQLHFTGPGTDLTVGLSAKAVFKGGGDIGPYGVEYEPNIPTEECFTTPDWRVTSGHVRATRPFFINGKLIEDLKIEFRGGEVAAFSARSGEATFAEYIGSDPGGKRLGEVALVGIDSPVFQSGLVFQEILFDENAACHIAVGSAYKFCLDGGDKMTQAELESLGCNESSVHTDMMISSEEVDVSAITYGGETIGLIQKGKWLKA